MNTVLSDAARDLYEQLTARTFYVVDTEFSTDTAGEHHLISIAIIPIVGGRRTKATDELHRIMKPGAPIDEFSTSIHGFTDADVAKKKPFESHARLITNRLTEDDAVFVCHNTIDAHVLRRELERLDERTADGERGLAGIDDLPVMPVVDTQRLVTHMRYPGLRKGTKTSLDTLCDVTGVPRTSSAHDARSDARATANAFIQLLRHTAENCIFWNIEDLLDAGSGGTTHSPHGPAHIRARRNERAALPPEHVAQHIHPLSDPVPAGSGAAEQWLIRAYECATLRCPYLRDEAQAAAAANGAVLIRGLTEDLPHLTEPGQAGTLLGAITTLITHADTTSPTLPSRTALRWWNGIQPVIAAAVPCNQDSASTMCPACLEGEPCPCDITYVTAAETVTLGGRGTMDDHRVRQLLSPSTRSYLNTWRVSHPEILAYALWRIARYERDEGHEEAAYTAIEQGIAMNLHLIEPRLAELACAQLVDNGDTTTAFTVAKTLLASRTTDTAYDDLADWVLFTEHALHTQQPTRSKAPTEPRRSRPAGHTNPRRYS